MLYEEITKYRELSGYTSPNTSISRIGGYLDGYERALEQEPKTGHWIPIYGNVKCSVCGSVKDSREVGRATHYCDFCGAKMAEVRISNEM